MKTLLVIAVLGISATQMPVILPKRIKVPAPVVHTFGKKAGKFLKYM